MSKKTRLTAAIVAAVVLAGGLLYTSFAGSSESRQPSQMGKAVEGKSYQLTGVVAKNSVKRDGGTLNFKIRDRKGSSTVPVRYSGEVPDPFREGREVIITVKRDGSAYVGKTGSLITKCPSKFNDKPQTASSATAG